MSHFCHKDCPNNNRQFFLGRDGEEPNLLVAFGTNGTLKVFSQKTGQYEDGVIVEWNGHTNTTEKQAEVFGCNITSLSLISTTSNDVSILNHTGFYIELKNTEITIKVKRKQRGQNVLYRSFIFL